MEYTIHRCLHGEEGLEDDPTGKNKSGMFIRHINHHVYMESKFRITFPFMLYPMALIPFYSILWISIGEIPGKCILIAVL